jgi:hypothetical protein
MLKHVVFFRLEGQSPEQEAAMLAACGGLMGVIPELKSFTMGRNVSPRDDQFTHSLVTDFDDLDACMRYVNDPRHVEVVQTHIAPYVKGRAIVDYDY